MRNIFRNEHEVTAIILIVDGAEESQQVLGLFRELGVVCVIDDISGSRTKMKRPTVAFRRGGVLESVSGMEAIRGFLEQQGYLVPSA